MLQCAYDYSRVIIMLTLVAIGLAGCRTPPTAPELVFTPPADTSVRPIAEPTAATETKTVELAALGRGNAVAVTIINHTDREMVVGPKFFAVIINGKLFPADPRLGYARTKFPIRRLRKNDGASGVFVFPKLPPLAGHRLVFNYPKVARAVTVIRAEKGPTPGKTAPVPKKKRAKTGGRDEGTEAERLKRELEKMGYQQ